MSQTRKRKAKRTVAGQVATAAHIKAETDLRNALTSVIITIGANLIDRWMSGDRTAAPVPSGAEPAHAVAYERGYRDGRAEVTAEVKCMVCAPCEACGQLRPAHASPLGGDGGHR